MERQGMLTTEELEVLSRSGEIDTVLCMFTDLQGRFMGKRVLPDFFLEEILGEEGLHACLYLLAIDMEMEPLPGYEYASWETGYGDFRMVPDVSTLRMCPWLEKTAMVICDIADEEDGSPVSVSPRQILKDQVAQLTPGTAISVPEVLFAKIDDEQRAAWAERFGGGVN